MQKKDLLVMAILVIAAIVLGAICGKLLLGNALFFVVCMMSLFGLPDHPGSR